MNGQNWSIDAQQLKSIVSVSSDGTAVTVDRDAVQRLVSGIAESVNRDATDAVLFVNGDGKLEIVPGVNSLAVNVDKTVDDISSSLVAGTHDVNVTIDQKQPAITDERANASLQMITNTLANGLSVKWDGGQKQITPTDLLSALVIKATPDQADAFGFSLSHEVLAGYIKAFAGDIEVEPHEPTFRLVNGEIKAEKKGQTGVVINYDSSAERIEKAIFSGYGSSNLKVDVIKDGVAKYGIKNPVFKPSPITPNYKDYLIFEGISVDEEGKQHYLDVHIAYRQACLNAIEYLKKFGYSGAQAYSILGTAPCQGHISGVVDVPNACATLWLPTEIFDFDIMPSSAGPIKHITGDIQMPISPDK